jgi:hypothetical protein
VIQTAQKTFLAASTESNAVTVLNSHSEITREKDSSIFCSGEELVAKIAPGSFCSRNYFDQPQDNWTAALSGNLSVTEIRQA